MVFQTLEKGGWKAYNVVVEYGNFMSRNLARICNLFNFQFFKKSSVLQKLAKYRTEHFYLIGHVFFNSCFGRFLKTWLEICIYSFERLFKRLKLLTKDTVIVIPPESSLILEILNEIPNDTTVESTLLNAKLGEPLQPAQKIEPSTPGSSIPLEKDESPAKSEKDYLAESIPSSNLIIVYENVTGLEKLFILTFDAFIVCPVNTAVAFLRFLRTIFREFEERVRTSQMNVKIASPLKKTILTNRSHSLLADILQPGHLDDSVIRLEYKHFRGLSGTNEEFLDKEMDSFNFYWEENDSDYKPIDASSDSCTGSESDIRIFPEEVSHILKTVEKPQESLPLKSEDQLIQSNGKNNCPNETLAPHKKKRKRKRRNRKSKSGTTQNNCDS